MLLRIFQGSKPMAASTTPTRIDSRISRNATTSGVPPRKRYRPSLAAGNSRVSLGIDGLPLALMDVSYSSAEKMGNLLVGVNGRQLRTLAILMQVLRHEPVFIPDRLSASAPAFPAGRPREAVCPSVSD